LDTVNLWKVVLGEIEIGISKASFITWFKNTEIISSNNGLVQIAVPNVFTKNQLEHKFNDQIHGLLKKNGVLVKAVEYIIKSSSEQHQSSKKMTVSGGTKPQTKGLSNKTGFNFNDIGPSGLNKKYTFDNYIVGGSNELAYTACLAAAKDPGSKYNPLFIYGGVGLGKTHLIQAVGNYILDGNPGAKILYISSEAFVKEFVACIRNKKPFPESYREADVLIVDDIQFIAGAEKTQEEFFHTFNVLHQHNKQIIISCDQQPKSLSSLTDRLQSRFEWGMTIDIQQPDYETRVAILQTKAADSGVPLSEETAEYLAANIQTNIRELEGVLNQLLAFCEVRNLQPDLDTAKALLNNARLRPKHITPKDIVKSTAKYFELEEDVLKGPKRDRDIVVPRQVAMYLLRSELHMSFPKVARELGRKDHTTAIHSVDKIEKSLRSDGLVRQHINGIKDFLYA